MPWTPRVIDDDALGSGETCDVEEPRSEEAEAQRALEEAYRRGRAEGLAEGQRTERESLAPLRLTLSAVVEEVGQRHDEWISTLDESLAALAVGIARQLIGRELEGNPEAVVDLVRRALSQFPVGQGVSIRLNPADLTLLSGAAAEGVATGRTDARWIADPLIEPGGCVVEGPDSVIDGRLDRALERVYRTLTDA